MNGRASVALADNPDNADAALGGSGRVHGRHIAPKARAVNLRPFSHLHLTHMTALKPRRAVP